VPASLIVEDNHFKFLRLQKGSLDRFGHDREAWHIAYEQEITKDFSSISKYLPSSCGSVLDIGGGLGGIDALLVRKFGTACEVCILDGVRDRAVVRLHRKTFNDMEVTRDFLTKNGVDRFEYRAPNNIGDPKPYDMIISMGSWCFHYPPDTYLKFAMACCHPGTVLIVDMRRDKPQWLREMGAAFQLVALVKRQQKYDRLAFHVR
jgi:SAM-dependent methyltransferase